MPVRHTRLLFPAHTQTQSNVRRVHSARASPLSPFLTELSRANMPWLTLMTTKKICAAQMPKAEDQKNIPRWRVPHPHILTNHKRTNKPTDPKTTWKSPNSSHKIPIKKQTKDAKTNRKCPNRSHKIQSKETQESKESKKEKISFE